MAGNEPSEISAKDLHHQFYSKLTNPMIGGQPSRWDSHNNQLTISLDFSAPPRAPDLASLIQEPYSYSALHSKSSFRLLKFGADGLSCELITTTLEDAPPYVALSYTWGPPDLTETLPLGPQGAWHAFPVTKNAYEALKCLGLSIGRQNRTLWVDAICINQRDKAERAAQVSIMRQIYEKATRVYVWLGSPSNETRGAIEQILEWDRSIDHQIESYKKSGKLQPGQKKISLSKNAFADVESEATWTRIYDLCAKEWWSRAWIVQEATSNPYTYMFCGTANIQIDTFYRVYDMIPGFQNREPKSADEQALVQLPYQLGEVRKIRRRGIDVSFLEALQHMRLFESSDPRDKVYTAYSLCPQIHEFLKPDYSKELHEVYIDVVRAYIASSNKEQTLDFLGYVVTDDNPEAEPNNVYPKPTDRIIPSWVPDWRFRLRFTPLSRQIQNGNGTTKNAYKASGSSAPSLDICGEELHIRGFKIDVIDEVHPMLRDAELAAAQAQHDPNPPGLLYTTGQNFREMTLQMSVADLRCELNGNCTRGYAIDWSLVAAEPEKLSREESEESKIMVKSFGDALCVRQVGITSNNFFGLVPDTAEVGDILCVLYGGQVLYLLRAIDGSLYRFVGECYIHGLMDGAALEFLELEEGISEEQVFVII